MLCHDDSTINGLDIFVKSDPAASNINVYPKTIDEFFFVGAHLGSPFGHQNRFCLPFQELCKIGFRTTAQNRAKINGFNVPTLCTKGAEIRSKSTFEKRADFLTHARCFCLMFAYEPIYALLMLFWGSLN